MNEAIIEVLQQVNGHLPRDSRVFFVAVAD